MHEHSQNVALLYIRGGCPFLVTISAEIHALFWKKMLYTFGQGAFHPMSLVIVLRVRIGSLWDPYRIPVLPSCALWSQVGCMHPPVMFSNGQIVQPAVPGRKFRRKFSTGDKKAMAFFGKFVRCRSNDMLKLWRALTNEQMGVEMPMKCLTNKFRARAGVLGSICVQPSLWVCVHLGSVQQKRFVKNVAWKHLSCSHVRCLGNVTERC